MKAEELMIGDWVLYAGLNPEIPQGAVRVSCLVRDPHELCVNDKLTTYQFVKPIPLTPEILELNGFSKDGSQIHRKKNTDYYTDYDIIVNPQVGSMCIEGIDGNCNRFSRYYVHELQHALRLCGLTELADNFKVE